MFEVSSSACHNSTNINVTVSATNLLGDGPPSDPITVPLQLQHNNGRRSEYINQWILWMVIHLFLGADGCPTYECSELVSSVSILLGALLNFSLLVIFVTVTCVLVRGKLKVQKKLELLKVSQEKEAKTIYEEVKPIHKVPSALFNTQENSA